MAVSILHSQVVFATTNRSAHYRPPNLGDYIAAGKKELTAGLFPIESHFHRL